MPTIQQQDNPIAPDPRTRTRKRLPTLFACELDFLQQHYSYKITQAIIANDLKVMTTQLNLLHTVLPYKNNAYKQTQFLLKHVETGIKQHNTMMVRLLLNRYKQRLQTDPEGYYELTRLAAEHGSGGILECVLNSISDKDPHKTNYIKTALFAASYHGMTQIASMMLTKYKTHLSKSSISMALNIAAQFNQHQFLCLIIQTNSRTLCIDIEKLVAAYQTALKNLHFNNVSVLALHLHENNIKLHSISPAVINQNKYKTLQSLEGKDNINNRKQKIETFLKALATIQTQDIYRDYSKLLAINTRQIKAEALRPHINKLALMSLLHTNGRENPITRHSINQCVQHNIRLSLFTNIADVLRHEIMSYLSESDIRTTLFTKTIVTQFIQQKSRLTNANDQHSEPFSDLVQAYKVKIRFPFIAMKHITRLINRDQKPIKNNDSSKQTPLDTPTINTL